MIYRYWVLPVFLLFSLFLHAKDTPKSWKEWKQTWRTYSVNKDQVATQKDSNVIRHIEVLDVRPDNEYIGAYSDKNSIPNGIVLSMPVNTFMNSKLAFDSSGHTILLVIRNWWISEANTFFYQNRMKLKKSNERKQDSINRLHLDKINAGIPISSLSKITVDVFVVSEGKYFPLVQLDTLLTDRKKPGKAVEILTGSMLYCLNKKITQAINTGKYRTRKAATIEQVTENYTSRFAIAALTADSMRKGVYHTWDQFKNNQPENEVFTVQRNGDEALLYTKNKNGNEVLQRNLFAVCDGKNIYKIQDGKVCNMYRNNHAFYWMGVAEYDQRTQIIPAIIPVPYVNGTPSGLGGFEAVGSKVKIIFIPYLINLETGEGYFESED